MNLVEIRNRLPFVFGSRKEPARPTVEVLYPTSQLDQQLELIPDAALIIAQDTQGKRTIKHFNTAFLRLDRATQVAVLQNQQPGETPMAAFFQTYMHDLKNSLTGPYGRAQMLASLPAGDPRVKEYAEAVVCGLRAAIDQTIRFPAQLEIAGELKKEPVDIIPMLKNIVAERVEIAKNTEEGLKQLEFNIDPTVPAQVINADPKIASVFTNVVTNGLQAMRGCPRQQLVISYEYSEKFFGILIQDTGGGILMHNPNDVFTKGKTTKQDGNGLGLFDARNIIEAHQGKIEIRRTGPSGTTMAIYLPWQKSYILA